jgi:hypothetical protein
MGATVQLSADASDNSATSVSVSGSTVVASWQYYDDGEGYTVYFSKSTNGGQSWSTPSSIAGHIDAPDPGPIPAIAGYSGGYLGLAYQKSNGLSMSVSANTGGSWTSLSVPGTSSGYNSPSPALSSTYWSTKQVNLAYASDVPSGSPSILWNYYDFQTSSWGTAVNVSGIVPAQYAHHANPSFAVSATEASGNKYMHVAWDAEDTYNPGTRVIVHRKGNFRSFYSEYSILQYQSQNKPSISGLSDAAAWVLYQNSNGDGVWKMHYNGSSWDGSYGTYIAGGFNPQISTGTTQARYIWTQGTSAPYQISVGTSALSKAGGWHYARTVNLTGPDGKSSVGFTLNAITLIHKGGTNEEAQFDFTPLDTTALTYTNAMEHLASTQFVVGQDVDSIIIDYTITGLNTASLSKQSSAWPEILLTESSTMLQTILTPKGAAASRPIADGRASRTATFVVPNSMKGRTISIGASITGLADTASLMCSIGHIYTYTGASSTPKEAGGESAARATLPTSYDLGPNYPNPFNPSTTIEYQMPSDGIVILTVYDALGREVATLANIHQPAGYYTAKWDGSLAASGIYFARFTVTNENGIAQYSKVNKLMLVK